MAREEKGRGGWGEGEEGLLGRRRGRGGCGRGWKKGGCGER